MADTTPDTPKFTITEVTETEDNGAIRSYFILTMIMVYVEGVTSIFGYRQEITNFVYQTMESVFDTFDLSDLSTIPGKIHIVQDANALWLSTKLASFYRKCYYDAVKDLWFKYYGGRNTGYKVQNKLNHIKSSYCTKDTIKDEICDVEFVECYQFAFSEQDEIRAKAGPNCDVFEVRKADGRVCFHVKNYSKRIYTLVIVNHDVMRGRF